MVLQKLVGLVLGMVLVAGAAQAADKPPVAVKPGILLVGLNVTDLQRSLDFYTKILGLKETRRYAFPQLTEVLLSYGGEGDTSLVLVHHKDHQGKYELGTGFSRVGFRLPDVRAVVNAARAAGYPVTREPMAAQGAILGFITDPDGYALELVQMP